MKAIILAAGTGSRLRPYTQNLPKCLIKIKGRAILERQISLLRTCGVKDILVVCGFHAGKVKLFCKQFKGVEVIFNPFYASSNSVVSVWLSMVKWNSGLFFINSDILLDSFLLKKVMRDNAQISVLVKKGEKDGYRVRLKGQNVKEMGMGISEKFTFGAYAGITKINKSVLKPFASALDDWLESGHFDDWYEGVVSEMARKGFRVKPILTDSYFWHEIDTPQDLKQTRFLLKSDTKL